jgi:hypothetical protein
MFKTIKQRIRKVLLDAAIKAEGYLDNAPPETWGKMPHPPKPVRGRTEPFSFDLELAMIPRLPTCPDGVTTEELKEAMGKVGEAMRANGVNYGTVTYYPRQKELYIRFPEEQVHIFG